MSCGVIWGNSIEIKKCFNIQQKIIMIIAGSKKSIYCRALFKKINILPLTSKFLLSLLSFIVDNTEKFQRNSDFHNITTKLNCSPGGSLIPGLLLHFKPPEMD
jgi:hypothetical protein